MKGLMRGLVGLAAVVMTTGSALAVPTYSTDFQAGTPKPGWRYYWNASSPLLTAGSPPALNVAGLVELTASGSSYVGSGPGAGSVSATATSLTPGQGTSQGDGIERYVLAAYTITAADLANGNQGSIDNYSFQVTPQDPPVSDGVNTIVFVNSNVVVATPIPPLPFPYTPQTPGGFPFPLGTLNAGDTVYVAIGSGATDTGDQFLVDYQIVLVPEPAAIGLIAIGAIGLLARRSRRRE
jgi:hypothetical protein